jgi:arylsulfatase A-like enzyme
MAGKKRRHYYTPAQDIFAALLPRIEHIGPKPAFVWTHLSDPHAPYDLAGKNGSDFERYLGEVALVDRKLGELFEVLDQTGLADRTLVIISADHGEAFGEHRSRTHGTTVYDEGLRVPLFLVPPKTWHGTPRRIEQLASTLDIAPTVLDVFGLPTPGYMMGQSLVPFLRDQNPTLERPIAAEARQFRTLITPDRWKIIVDLQKNRSELYDLKNDPAEKHNLAGNADALREPRAILDAFFAAHELKRKGYKRLIVR